MDSCDGIRRESLSFGKLKGVELVGCALDREPVEGGDLGTAGWVSSRTARGDDDIGIRVHGAVVL